jgi:6-pyruvoyltetrahydropterin/6-carboxytetrahydropterin synthase
MQPQIHYFAQSRFEAARRLERLPRGHPRQGLHGHGFRIAVRGQAPGSPCPGGEPQALGEALEQRLAPLRYHLVNETVRYADDAPLLRWVADGLAVPEVDGLTLSGDPRFGMDRDAKGALHAWRSFRIEAAHRLPNVPEGHKCGRMHGHGFTVVLYENVDGGDEVDAPERIAGAWAPLEALLDHACLNDIGGLDNPTSEHLAAWIWQRVELPALSGITVSESATTGCHYDGSHFRIWKQQDFEAAVRLEAAREGDPRRALHGHSYRVRLHLSASLDTVMGWTVDYGDVKERFRPVYAELDHHTVNELGVDGDVGGLAAWIGTRVRGGLPECHRVELLESPGRGAVADWAPAPTFDPLPMEP